jgi:choline dehydrogenase-like flavoprotein
MIKCAGASDQWAEMVGDQRWSWESLLPAFKRVETWVPSQEMIESDVVMNRMHGTDGPITVYTICSSKWQYE